MNFSLWRVKHANKCTKALKMPFPNGHAPFGGPLVGLCRTNKQSEMGIKYGESGRNGKTAKRQTTAGNFPPVFFLAFPFVFFSFLFFFLFCQKVLVAPLAQFLWPTPTTPPLAPTPSGHHEYLCKTHTHTHLDFCCSFPVSLRAP